MKKTTAAVTNVQQGVLAAREGDFLRGLTLLEDAYADANLLPKDAKAAEGLSFYGLCLALVEKKYKAAIDA